MLPEVCSKDFNVAHALQPILVSFEMDTDHFPSDLAMRLALRNCVLASGMGSDPEILHLLLRLEHTHHQGHKL